MAKQTLNPFAFRPLPVSIFLSLSYIALFTVLLVVHLSVPPAPSHAVPVAGINTTDAWLDLQYLSNGYHPYNSHRNDVVRNWLLKRMDEILVRNNVTYSSVDAHPSSALSLASRPNAPAVIFNDLTSNVTFSSGNVDRAVVTTYFEGSNIMVYLRGTEDPEGAWWTSGERPQLGSILVNAHFDSVSTGFGVTDDGAGVISLLQLLDYFSLKGRQTRRGLVLLFNNGEEDGLNGAYAFARHPIAAFTHVFLNLEGAGAGGRATLFRSTDTEVTRFYKGSPHPFGSATSGDAFKRGAIRSRTDYSVFNEKLGMRGLDVAFYEHRARYHTDQDDTRHSSKASLWHMLSASIHTVEGLCNDGNLDFEGEPQGRGQVPAGRGSDAVWFDLFGLSFVVFELHTLFALSVTLLVIGPVSLIIAAIALSANGRLYLFSLRMKLHPSVGPGQVSLYGLRGFFRFPVIFAVASVVVVGLAFLQTKLNPYVIESSPWTIWAMLLSAWVFVAWFLSRATDFLRPTAFQRTYALLWLFLGGWLALVVSTVSVDKIQLAAGYPVVFFFAAIFLATLMAVLEQFSLERKSDYAERQLLASNDEFQQHEEAAGSRPSTSGRSARQEPTHEDGAEEDATESTSLLGRAKKMTFANYATANDQQPSAQTDHESLNEDDSRDLGVYEDEQKWSGALPTWTWIPQFLILGPFPIILFGNLSLLLTTALYQTLSDGNPPLLIYLSIAFLAIMAMAPLSPFLHRFTYHVPTILLFVFIGTIIYNLIAFPFSGNNRLKLYFQQHVDLDTGLNEVSLVGIGNPYMEQVIATLPSAAGQKIKKHDSTRRDLVEYSWSGLPPTVVPNTAPHVPPSHGYSDWLRFNISRAPESHKASLSITTRASRSCRVEFDPPVHSIQVQGSDEDGRFPPIPEEGSRELRLWSRTWQPMWKVDVVWSGSEGLDGRVVCLWNDEEGFGRIPALAELHRFAPDWVAITKLDDGLVAGSKAFKV